MKNCCPGIFRENAIHIAFILFLEYRRSNKELCKPDLAVSKERNDDGRFQKISENNFGEADLPRSLPDLVIKILIVVAVSAVAGLILRRILTVVLILVFVLVLVLIVLLVLILVLVLIVVEIVVCHVT